ncbi:MAG: hypothetical protein V4502_07030 [Pseudomonadota bacterium]
MLRDIWTTVVAAMTSWHQGKLFIEHSFDFSHDSMHIIVGLLAWLVAAMVLRRPITEWRPWLWAFALIFWNEIVDLVTERWAPQDRGWQYGEGVKDLVLTMIVPTILMFAARYRPDLFRKGLGRGGRR